MLTPQKVNSGDSLSRGYKASPHLSELDHDGDGGGDDDGERDEEADREEEQVVAHILPLPPGRGAADRRDHH